MGARELVAEGEQLARAGVDLPVCGEGRINAAKIDLTARLTAQVTIGVGPRIQHDELTGRTSRSVVFQVALKTVH